MSTKAVLEGLFRKLAQKHNELEDYSTIKLDEARQEPLEEISRDTEANLKLKQKIDKFANAVCDEILGTPNKKEPND